jgi:hypothetical protein
MLRSAEVTAVLELGAAPHVVQWKGVVEFSLDCFICRRNGRTTELTYGTEEAACSGGGRIERHPAAARIAAFDHTLEERRTSLRLVVDYWWAPFHDAERDEPALALTGRPWVRLNLGYLCPAPTELGTFQTQSNVVRPHTYACKHCAAPLATTREAPRIRLLT